MAKPVAETLPGGAPVKKKTASKRPCKYGPRDADGYCPKKPKATRSSSTTKTASKRPCKYGPRDADGRCPKKQTQSQRRAENVVKAVTGSPERKAQARRDIAKDVKKSTAKAAEIAIQKPIERAIRPAARKRAKEKVKEWAGAAASGAATFAKKIAAPAGILTAWLATQAGLSAAMKDRIRREATQMLKDTIARTPPGQRYQYTPEVQAQLLQQYAQHVRNQLDVLFTK
jgi:hypothetical protein